MKIWVFGRLETKYRMNFDDFTRELGDGSRSEVTQGWASCRLLFSDKAHHRQFVINLEAECRLPHEAWEAACRVVIQGITDGAGLQRAFAGVFRLHTLRGGPVTLPPLVPLGRAVTLPLFMRMLKAQFGFSSDFEAEQLLNDLLNPKASTNTVRETLEGMLLGTAGRPMWATFDVDVAARPSGRNPFDNMPADADGIREMLGLSKNDKGKDLLLFVYGLPEGVAALYPTIADAYAGDEWAYYFRPSLEGESWGMTMPWSEEASPRPEIVHEAVKADSLSDRIRIVRG